MRTFKKRLIPMLLALALSLSLLPVTARAAADPYDVYQGDGFYITATPFQISSPKYTVGASTRYKAGDKTFHNGVLLVWSDEDYDGNYVNRQFVDELNLVDKNGNVLLPEGSMMANSTVYNYSRYQHYDPSDGVFFYWDGITKDSGEHGDPLLGLMDLNGNRITDCRYSYNITQPFHDGAALVREGKNWYSSCIDTRGNVLFSCFEKNGRSISIWTKYNDGLAAAQVSDESVREIGFLDKQGNMALKLLSFSREDIKNSDYWTLYAQGKTDGYLVPYYGTFSTTGDFGGFSEGYAVCYDLRSGNEKDYNFAIIDTSGRVVGTFSDAKPCGDVHDGLIRVDFINNRGGSDGIGFVDVTGKVVLRDVPQDTGNLKRNFQNDFSCGVTLDRSELVDTKGQTVIPSGQFKFASLLGFQDNLCLAYAHDGEISTRLYLLEIHQGTYTGPGRVYNHSQGGEVSAAPAQPQQPVTPSQPASSGSKSAAPTNDRLTVNGVPATPTVYKIDGNNYFKIRDVAALLNGTEKQFSVGYDNALKSVTVTTGQSYALQSGDLAGASASGNRTAAPSNDTVYVNGQKIDAQVYKIDGGNYFKLRDLGKALNFNVDWTQEQGMMIDTSKPYIE